MKILVAYYSMYGHVYKLAQAAAEGAAGVKVTLIWHVPAAAREPPQFWLKPKSPLLAPVSEMLVMANA